MQPAIYITNLIFQFAGVATYLCRVLDCATIALLDSDLLNILSQKLFLSVNLLNLRYFIYSVESKVEIILETDPKIIKLSILDDGPGFPEDILKIIGEPYITTKYKDLNEKSGLGLGTFIGKTLLERNFAKLKFSNLNKGGAKVEITWNTSDIKI